jgi:non-ribosomal peptide synthetase component F
LYGTLKAGAAYVPLDPRAPTARLAYMLAKCGVAAMVAGAGGRRGLEALAGAGPSPRTVVVLGDADASGIELSGRSVVRGAPATPDPPANGAASGDDLGYVLFTSGSTGRPKGVMLSHANGRAFVDWAVAEFRIGPSDRLASHAPLHFDLSVLDVFAAAAAGATLVLVPAASAPTAPATSAVSTSRATTTCWGGGTIRSSAVATGSSWRSSRPRCTGTAIVG